MSKVAKNKVFGIVLVVAMTLLSSVCLCALNWSYISDCTRGLEERRVGILQKKGVLVVGTTLVDPPNYAGITLYLEKLDEDGDWVGVKSWSDLGSQIAGVDEEYACGTGTFRVKTVHKAYEPDDLDTAVEIHSGTSDSITIY